MVEDIVHHPQFGDTVRRRLINLAHLYDERVPAAINLGADVSITAEEVTHPLELLLIEGPRSDPKYCLQRLRALWLVSENVGGQLTNDPVIPFRHQSALIQFLMAPDAPRRVLIADEVGLGKTVEAGLLIRQRLQQEPRTRILYLTLGGLVPNVLDEFQRLDLPRWQFYANVADDIWQGLNALPTPVIAAETPLVVASIHKLCESDRWRQQHAHLGDATFDLIIVDECHTLRAYGAAAESPQVWFRCIRQLLEDHLAQDGRVLFLSATPHQGNREVFLNLVALCVGAPLNATEKEKAIAARGHVVFRVKEHVRDWNDGRIFPARDVRPPRLAEPPEGYQNVLNRIASYFDWLAQHSERPQSRVVGFVKSQALQYAASSLRAGFSYLLRRLVRYYPSQADTSNALRWATRLVPYRARIATPQQLLNEWIREFRDTTPDFSNEEQEGELSDDVGPRTDVDAELPMLLDLIGLYDSLFDDAEAAAKFNVLYNLIDGLPEPIVIFSQAVDTVYELESRLKGRGYEVYRLTGDMPMADRPAVIRAFCQSSTPKRILLSSAAGGVGINLQVARVAVHFDLPWNPMVLEQRVGRVHRIGSTRTIIVETILLRGSREADVLERITGRLRDIVRDLSSDQTEREALFRRILASLDPEVLRQIFSGEEDLDAIGEAVDAGRRAVDEADRNMRELAVQTKERLGRASMERLISFLGMATTDFKKVGTRLYAVLEDEGQNELREIKCQTDVFRFEDSGTLIFDRTAASYLGLRREETGGLGNSNVDPIIRSTIDLATEAKSRSSAWVALPQSSKAPLSPGDVVYFVLEADCDSDTLSNVRMRAFKLHGSDCVEIDGDGIEQLLWQSEFLGSRKAGDVGSFETLCATIPANESARRISFPVAAIGIRERAER